MRLDIAQKYADAIISQLRPFCEKIEVAGSVRRVRPVCNDIDIVLLPRAGARPDIDARILAAPGSELLKGGEENVALRLSNGVQVDFFFAKPPRDDLAGYVPGNFGMRLLVATGSRAHNIDLARRAEARGLHLSPYRGLMRGGVYQGTKEGLMYQGGEVFRGEDELSILTELGLGWIPPDAREIK